MIDLLSVGSSHGYLRLVIGVPFALVLEGRQQQIDPEDPRSVAAALQILHKPGRAVRFFEDGTLELALDADALLRVEKHERFEAWEANGEGELEAIQFLCSPHPGPPWPSTR